MPCLAFEKCVRYAYLIRFFTFHLFKHCLKLLMRGRVDFACSTLSVAAAFPENAVKHVSAEPSAARQSADKYDEDMITRSSNQIPKATETCRMAA